MEQYQIAMSRKHTLKNQLMEGSHLLYGAASHVDVISLFLEATPEPTHIERTGFASYHWLTLSLFFPAQLKRPGSTLVRSQLCAAFWKPTNRPEVASVWGKGTSVLSRLVVV